MHRYSCHSFDGLLNCLQSSCSYDMTAPNVVQYCRALLSLSRAQFYCQTGLLQAMSALVQLSAVSFSIRAIRKSGLHFPQGQLPKANLLPSFFFAATRFILSVPAIELRIPTRGCLTWQSALTSCSPFRCDLIWLFGDLVVYLWAGLVDFRSYCGKKWCE